jgi:hypothetical protein
VIRRMYGVLLVVLLLTGLSACGGGDSAAHPKVLLNSQATLSTLKQSLADNTAPAQRFQAFVDSELAAPGTNYAFQYWFAALMYKVTGQPRYADFAVTKIDAFVASEEALIAAGNRPAVSSDSYLDVGPLVGDVALVYDWCNASLTPAQRTRWVAYMNQAVSNVWNPATASWGGKSFPWSGWSVDNPSNNYYYSFLRATMLVGLATQGESDQSKVWMDTFRKAKIDAQLMPTFNRDLEGGGSREGTGYGTAMKNLFQLYDWWERSTGERLADLTPHTLASEAWLLHAIVPTQDYLAAIGDQARESSVALFDYHREYLLSLMSLYPQERLSSVAKAVLLSSSVPKMQYGFEAFADYLYQPSASMPTAQVTDMSSAYWGSGTGQLFMRSAWGDKAAAYSTLTCGPYTESHAHRDQGAFQIYRGEWLAPTSNIYTHSGIQQGEEFNNLVRIVQGGNTVAQKFGAPQCKLAALANTDLFTYASTQITPIYGGQAAVSKVEREYVFIKPSTFVVFDRVASAAGTQRIWTLNLMGNTLVDGDRLTITAPKSNKLDVYRVAPTGLTYQVSSPALPGDSWLQQPKRVEVTDTAGAQTQFLHVLGTNGSVSSVVRSDATGQTGVQINLADGRQAVVRFANASTGGTLEIRAADSTVLTSGGLPTTVVAPPLFRN